MANKEARPDDPSTAAMLTRGFVIAIVGFVPTFAVFYALGVRGPLLAGLGGAGAGLAIVVERVGTRPRR